MQPELHCHVAASPQRTELGSFARLGLFPLLAKVTLIEGHKMSGHCLNFGGVPGKALIRSAILGLTGAGGLGLLISEAVSLFQWSRLATLLIVVVALVMVFDALSRRVRRALL